MSAIDARIGHPKMSEFSPALAAAASYQDMEVLVRSAVGPTDLMEFMRFDISGVLQKGEDQPVRKSVRLVTGNPLIMRRMAERVPDAASYAPVTILIDERADGVRLSYDRMASFLAPYGNPTALTVARELDAKIEAILTAAAR